MAKYLEGHDYGSEACRGCSNNVGVCLYDMELEAEENGVKLEILVDKTHCLYAEYND